MGNIRTDRGRTGEGARKKRTEKKRWENKKGASTENPPYANSEEVGETEK